MTKEDIIWADVKGYEGYYQVSNTGLVRSKDRLISYCRGRVDMPNGRLMRKKKRKDGYLMVEFCKNHKKKTFKIHRLVA